MGYTTSFEGKFIVTPPLAPAHIAYLKAFNETRRVKRDPRIAEGMADPRRIAVGLPVGPDGCYFVGGSGFMGQDRDASTIDHNEEPDSQPGLWCQWVPSEDGEHIQWDEGEKFYRYVEWLQYLVDHFLKPWGYRLDGTVKWEGESARDFGVIVAKGNEIRAEKGR